jgi:hypothetical protein
MHSQPSRLYQSSHMARAGAAIETPQPGHATPGPLPGVVAPVHDRRSFPVCGRLAGRGCYNDTGTI